MLGVLIALFATIGAGTPVWRIVMQVFVLGLFTSMQYSSMNTLVYSDVPPEKTSGASAITSTTQQMSISFGIAIASLVTEFFITDRAHATSAMMIDGIHKALLILGGWTVLSSLIFSELKPNDGDKVSMHKAEQHVD
jgi:MFS family permease